MQGGKAVCSKLFNNSKPLRKKSEGFAGKVRRDKKSVVFVENGSAMRAAGCLDGNLRQAVRALLGGRCSGCLFVLAERSGFVHELDERKQHDCHNKEVDDRRDKGTILDVHAEYGQHKILEIGLCNETDERRNNVIGQGRDNVLECRADDNTDSQVNDVAAQGKFFEFINQFSHANTLLTKIRNI